MEAGKLDQDDADEVTQTATAAAVSSAQPVPPTISAAQPPITPVTGGIPVTAHGNTTPSPFQPFQMMESLLEKLKLLVSTGQTKMRL